jgi:hypothetical protein
MFVGAAGDSEHFDTGEREDLETKTPIAAPSRTHRVGCDHGATAPWMMDHARIMRLHTRVGVYRYSTRSPARQID